MRSFAFSLAAESGLLLLVALFFLNLFFKNASEVSWLTVLIVLPAYVYFRMLLFARSIRRATEMLEEAALGRRLPLPAKSPYKETKRLFELSKSIRKQMSKTMENGRYKADQLREILRASQAAILVLNQEGVIVNSNEAATKLLGPEIRIGRFYWEAVRVQAILALLEKPPRDQYSRIRANNKIFLARTSETKNSKFTILTLHDITRESLLEEIEKDFAANVSHELRTPLTAILGFAETLASDLEGESKRYVEIIVRHTNRMIQIIESLLLLTSYEGEHFKAENASNLIAEAENALELLRPKAKAKGLKLRFRFDENLPPVYVDSLKMEQLFINLIDNAIKYTPLGSVEVEIQSASNGIQILVSDTGPGIDEDLRERVYDRFYTIHPSRSRKTGGTGLGLSIVKKIVDLHEGDIAIEEKKPHGTIVKVLIPHHPSSSKLS